MIYVLTVFMMILYIKELSYLPGDSVLVTYSTRNRNFVYM